MAIIINGSTGVTFPDSTTQATSGVTPSGTVIYVAQNTAPTGYIKANGAAVSRTTYAALFAAIGTTFGAGDGSTTFLVPDLRGEFIRGWDDSRGIDSGRSFGSAQADEFKSHSHTVNSGFGSYASYSFSTGDPTWYPTSYSTNATGGTETRPRNIALLACIKF
jgi:phage-related tail fiber protein